MNNIWTFNYNPKKHPCWDCKERSAECHGKCEKYAEFEKNKKKPVGNQFSPMGKAKCAVLRHKKHEH